MKPALSCLLAGLFHIHRNMYGGDTRMKTTVVDTFEKSGNRSEYVEKRKEAENAYCAEVCESECSC